MDSSSGVSRLVPHRTTSVPHSQTPTNSVDGNRMIANRFGEMSRGRSHGEILSGGTTSQIRRATDESLRDGEETFMDFLRQSGGAEITRRAAIMATDRKRRLTGPQEEQARRRSASSMSIGQLAGGGSVGQTRSGGMRQSASQSTSSLPLASPSATFNHNPGIRATDRPLPPRPIRTYSQSRRSTEITLPRWQSDTEVSSCPICGAKFSFWYRKHHCRKCGRVVCAGCSPHRITIPRQFIVHSPSECSQDPSSGFIPSPTIIDLTSDDEDGAARPSRPANPPRGRNESHMVDPALGGGQEVRLCNPCVPDPNPLPHLPFTPPNRYTFNSFPAPENVGHVNPQRSQQPRDLQQRPTRTDSGHQHHRKFSNPNLNREQLASSSTSVGPSVTTRRESGASRASGVPVPNHASMYGSAPNPSIHERNLAAYVPQYPHSQYHHRSNHVPPSSRHPPPADLGSALHARAAPQALMREEDECPICHSPLPRRGPDGSEVAREAHVSACIDSHFSTSSPQASRPPPSAAIEAAVAASVATPSQAGGRAGPVPVNRSEGSQDRDPIPPRWVPRMLTYHASEKDCVVEDGEGVQECVICFEEFAVGDEMGRLECLCKFHKACISQWWDTKGAGACPVHQGGM